VSPQTLNPLPPKNWCCLACGATDGHFYARTKDEEYLTCQDEFDFFRCGLCKSLSIYPVPSDRLSLIYPQNYYSFSKSRSVVSGVKNWLDSRFYKKILCTVQGQELAALDVGGGSGAELNKLRSVDPRIKRTEVVDLDSKAADHAKAAGHQYHCLRIEDFETASKFDVILMLNLIEHVEDPCAVLTKACSLLSPGGVILLKTPNYESLDGAIFKARNWGGFHSPRHWVIFNRRGFEVLAQKAGATVQQFQYTQGAPFWATSILFILARHRWIRITKERPAVNHPAFQALSAFFAFFDLIRCRFSKPSQMFFILSKDH